MLYDIVFKIARYYQMQDYVINTWYTYDTPFVCTIGGGTDKDQNKDDKDDNQKKYKKDKKGEF